MCAQVGTRWNEDAVVEGGKGVAVAAVAVAVAEVEEASRMKNWAMGASAMDVLMEK